MMKSRQNPKYVGARAAVHARSNPVKPAGRWSTRFSSRRQSLLHRIAHLDDINLDSIAGVVRAGKVLPFTAAAR
jgi:hypothetical protein